MCAKDSKFCPCHYCANSTQNDQYECVHCAITERVYTDAPIKRHNIIYCDYFDPIDPDFVLETAGFSRHITSEAIQERKEKPFAR